MTALKNSGDIERFLKNPDATTHITLIYGPDHGLVSERTKTLVQSVAGTLDDPFSIVRLNDSELSDDPGRLADEANALTFSGTRRIVWVDDGGQNTVRALEALDQTNLSCLIIVAAGNLKPLSKLRKYAESNKFAVAIACYLDEPGSLNDVLDQELKKFNLTMTPDARHYFIGLLGADRQLSRREIEKLCLYAANQNEITAEDIRAISGDSTSPSLDSLCDAVGQGDVDQADRIYNRTILAGIPATVVISQLIRHFTLLDWFASQAMRTGTSARSLVRPYRPPIFFKRHGCVERQTGIWSHENLKSALALLQKAESQCRTSALPTNALAERAVLSLSLSARRQQRSG